MFSSLSFLAILSLSSAFSPHFQLRSAPFRTQLTRNSAVEATNGEDLPFSIETTNDGPGDGPVHRLTFHRLTSSPSEAEEPETPIVLETGKIGRQASGAVTLTRGETVLYATASRDEDPKEQLDFLPLSVEHQERFSSAGLTSGPYQPLSPYVL